MIIYPRVRAISELVNPHVEAVGQVLLSSAARDGVFKDGAAPAFSVTVSCSSGTTHEDVATGIRVKDLDATGDSRVPIPGAQYTVKAHPSGRLRFDFTVPALPPGRFQVKVAFTIKESGQPPMLSDGRFEVRPQPGYVPPREEDVSVRAPLQFPSSKAPSSRPMAPDPALDPPSDASDAALFPEPIAPSSPGTDAGVSHSNLGPQPLPTSPATTSTALPITGETNEPDTIPVPEYQQVTTTPPIDVSTSDWSASWESLPETDTLTLPKTPKGQGSPQDLPTWNAGGQAGNAKKRLEEAANRLGPLLWQNNLVAFGAILVALVFFLAVVGFAMQSCAG